MTRQEFIDGVTSLHELIDFCYEENLDYCDDVYSEESYNGRIEDELEERARNDSWQDVRDWLYYLPDRCDYYIRDNYGDWSEANDDDFENTKNEILELYDDNDYWDEDEEEEEIEEYHDPEDEIPVEDEDVSFDELFTTCNSKVQKIVDDKTTDTAAEEETIDFDAFFALVRNSNREE